MQNERNTTTSTDETSPLPRTLRTSIAQLLVTVGTGAALWFTTAAPIYWL